MLQHGGGGAAVVAQYLTKHFNYKSICAPQFFPSSLTNGAKELHRCSWRARGLDSTLPPCSSSLHNKVRSWKFLGALANLLHRCRTPTHDFSGDGAEFRARVPQRRHAFPANDCVCSLACDNFGTVCILIYARGSARRKVLLLIYTFSPPVFFGVCSFEFALLACVSLTHSLTHPHTHICIHARSHVTALSVVSKSFPLPPKFPFRIALCVL